LECEQQEGGEPTAHWLSVLDDRCRVLPRWNQDCISLWQHTGLSLITLAQLEMCPYATVMASKLA